MLIWLNWIDVRWTEGANWEAYENETSTQDQEDGEGEGGGVDEEEADTVDGEEEFDEEEEEISQDYEDYDKDDEDDDEEYSNEVDSFIEGDNDAENDESETGEYRLSTKSEVRYRYIVGGYLTYFGRSTTERTFCPFVFNAQGLR